MAVQRYDVRDLEGAFLERQWRAIDSPIHGEDGPLAFLLHVEDVTDQVGRRSVFELRSLDAAAPHRSPSSLPVAASTKCSDAQAGHRTMTCVSTPPAASPESECCTFMPVVGHLKRILRSMAAAALVRCRSIPSGRPRGIEMRQSEHGCGGVEWIPYLAASSSVGPVTVAQLRTPRNSGLRASFATAIWVRFGERLRRTSSALRVERPPTDAAWWPLPPAELGPGSTGTSLSARAASVPIPGTNLVVRR